MIIWPVYQQIKAINVRTRRWGIASMTVSHSIFHAQCYSIEVKPKPNAKQKLVLFAKQSINKVNRSILFFVIKNVWSSKPCILIEKFNDIFHSLFDFFVVFYIVFQIDSYKPFSTFTFLDGAFFSKKPLSYVFFLFLKIQ